MCFRRNMFVMSLTILTVFMAISVILHGGAIKKSNTGDAETTPITILAPSTGTAWTMHATKKIKWSDGRTTGAYRIILLQKNPWSNLVQTSGTPLNNLNSIPVISISKWFAAGNNNHGLLITGGDESMMKVNKKCITKGFEIYLVLEILEEK